MLKGLSTIHRMQRLNPAVSCIGSMFPDITSSSHRFKSDSSQFRQRRVATRNTIILFVPQQQAWVVERFGKFHAILEPGLNFLVPIVDSIRYIQILKELVLDIEEQSAITADNVTLNINAVLYVKVTDPYKASYGVDDAEKAIRQLAQTNMRSEIGKISLDNVFRERESLNYNIVAAINKASDVWGLDCKRYEIRDVMLPKPVQEAMQLQVEAERRKRASVLESEGIRTSDINIAEGQKQARILKSEANKTEQINLALGEAEAMLAIAKAKATAIEVVASALGQKDGQGAATLKIAEQYIEAFRHLAKEGNTLILPSNPGDVTNMVAQAMSIYKTIQPGTSQKLTSEPSIPHKVVELTHRESLNRGENIDDSVTKS